MSKSKNKTLILIRGLPGSGKSTLARKMCRGQAGAVHYENDMFHLRESDGVYDFKPELAIEGSNWCFNSTANAMEEGSKLIVVSNAFIKLSSIKRYTDLAETKGYTVQIIQLDADFGSIHNVPDEVLSSMKANWESLG